MLETIIFFLVLLLSIVALYIVALYITAILLIDVLSEAFGKQGVYESNAFNRTLVFVFFLVVTICVLISTLYYIHL